MHALTALDLGLVDEGLKYYKMSRGISLELSGKSRASDGIHSAAMGGIWQNVVLGFGGLRVIEDTLTISPALPDEWSDLTYAFSWQGDRFEVNIDKVTIRVDRKSFNGKPVIIRVYGIDYTFNSDTRTVSVDIIDKRKFFAEA